MCKLLRTWMNTTSLANCKCWILQKFAEVTWFPEVGTGHNPHMIFDSWSEDSVWNGAFKFWCLGPSSAHQRHSMPYHLHAVPPILVIWSSGGPPEWRNGGISRNEMSSRVGQRIWHNPHSAIESCNHRVGVHLRQNKNRNLVICRMSWKVRQYHGNNREGGCNNAQFSDPHINSQKA